MTPRRRTQMFEGEKASYDIAQKSGTWFIFALELKEKKPTNPTVFPSYTLHEEQDPSRPRKPTLTRPLPILTVAKLQKWNRRKNLSNNLVIIILHKSRSVSSKYRLPSLVFFSVQPEKLSRCNYSTRITAHSKSAKNWYIFDFGNKFIMTDKIDRQEQKPKQSR